jgi:hypothetical protein
MCIRDVAEQMPIMVCLSKNIQGKDSVLYRRIMAFFSSFPAFAEFVVRARLTSSRKAGRRFLRNDATFELERACSLSGLPLFCREQRALTTTKASSKPALSPPPTTTLLDLFPRGFCGLVTTRTQSSFPMSL